MFWASLRACGGNFAKQNCKRIVLAAYSEGRFNWLFFRRTLNQVKEEEKTIS